MQSSRSWDRGRRSPVPDVKPCERALLLALLPLLVAAGGCGGSSAGGPGSDPLGLFLAARRVAEGRFAGIEAWAPCDMPAEGLGARCPDLPPLEAVEFGYLLAALDGGKDGEAGGGPAGRSAPVARLLAARRAGRAESALATLETLAASGEPGALSDLAAARLHRASTDGDPRLLLAALEAAEAAVAGAPGMAEARFNLAAAAERLGLLREAEAAWRVYLKLDAGGGWAAEARRRIWRLHRLAHPAAQEACRRRLAGALEGDRRDELAAIAGECPDAAIEVGFGRLLDQRIELAASPGESAGGWEAGVGSRFSRLADAWLEATGDRYLADVAAYLDAGVPRGSALGAAWRDLRSAMADAEAGRRGAARSALARAHSRLDRVGGPLALLAARHRAAAAYRDEPVEAERLARELLARAAAAGYHELAAKGAWIAGVVAFESGRLGEAASLLWRAEERIERLGSRRQRAAVLSIRAGVRSYLGDAVGAWRLLHRALELSALAGISERYPVILGAAVRQAAGLGFHRAALRIGREALAADLALGRPLAAAEAWWRLARVRRLAGDASGAAEDLERAFEEVERIADPALRRHTRAGLLHERGLLAAGERPAAALADLEAALDLFAEGEFTYSTIELRSARARLLRGLGREAEAGLELVSLLAELERQASAAGNPAERVRLFEGAAEVVNAMLEIELQKGADPASTLVLAERARAAWLAERLGAIPAEGVVSGLARYLGEGETLVVYQPMEHGTAWWMLEEGGLRAGRLAAGAARLEGRVEALRSALVGGRSEEAGEVAAELWRALIEPLGGAPSGLLTVVPGGALAGLPWAALVDPATGRRVVRGAAVRVVPGARVAAALAARARRPEAAGPVGSGLLAVGDPAFEERRFPELSRLPAAASEAIAVASLAPDSALLVGAAATPQRVRREVAGRGLVQVSAHARSSPHPLGSELLLAAGPEGDGVVTGLDLLDWPFAEGCLVVLASCASGGGYRSPVSGSVGLAQAVLAAGAAAVVATLWSIDDATTGPLLERFYRELAAGADAAEALRRAQLAAADSPDPALAHPRTWAAFQLVGSAPRSDHRKEVTP